MSRKERVAGESRAPPPTPRGPPPVTTRPSHRVPVPFPAHENRNHPNPRARPRSAPSPASTRTGLTTYTAAYIPAIASRATVRGA